MEPSESSTSFEEEYFPRDPPQGKFVPTEPCDIDALVRYSPTVSLASESLVTSCTGDISLLIANLGASVDELEPNDEAPEDEEDLSSVRFVWIAIISVNSAMELRLCYVSKCSWSDSLL
jgi:hypothetical protein